MTDKKDIEGLDDMLLQEVQDTTDTKEMIRELFSANDQDGKSNIDLKTELSDKDISNHTIVETFAEALKHFDDMSNDFVISSLSDKVKRLKVSKDRGGRREAVDIFKGDREHKEGKGLLGGWPFNHKPE